MPTLFAWLSAWVSLVALAAGINELNDLSARMQFHYYAADARALQAALQQVAALDVAQDPRSRDYQLAYGNWKLAELLRTDNRVGARRAANACVDAAERGLAAVPKRGSLPRPDVMHAELHAMQAGCYIELSETPGGSRAAGALEDARAAQPNNARVLLVNAQYSIARAKSAVERAEALRKIAAAVAAFESQGASNAGDWGHAEALLRLGELQLNAGDATAARNSAERALVLAPDYVSARALLARAVRGP